MTITLKALKASELRGYQRDGAMHNYYSTPCLDASLKLLEVIEVVSKTAIAEGPDEIIVEVTRISRFGDKLRFSVE